MNTVTFTNKTSIIMVLLRRVSSIHGPAVFVAFFGRYRLKVTDQPAAADVGFYSPRNKRLMMSQDERARLSRCSRSLG